MFLAKFLLKKECIYLNFLLLFSIENVFHCRVRHIAGIFIFEFLVNEIIFLFTFNPSTYMDTFLFKKTLVM